MSKIYKPTHKLKKEFRYSPAEKYPAGTLIYLSRRGLGFGRNALFLNKDCTLAVNDLKAVAAFSLDIFKPQKDWFEKI